MKTFALFLLSILLLAACGGGDPATKPDGATRDQTQMCMFGCVTIYVGPGGGIPEVNMHFSESNYMDGTASGPTSGPQVHSVVTFYPNERAVISIRANGTNQELGWAEGWKFTNNGVPEFRQHNSQGNYEVVPWPCSGCTYKIKTPNRFGSDPP